jgi:flagella basal body P-ring formation protein FlgA
VLAGDHIVAKDVALGIPEFASLKSEEPVALAPQPGVRRTIGKAEQLRIASRFGLLISPKEDLCFEIPTQILTAEQMTKALRAAIDDPGVELELLEWSKYAVPAGELQFSTKSISVSPALTSKSAVIWRGKLVYGDKRAMVVWARVRLAAKKPLLLASVLIPAGKVIESGEVRVETVEQFALAAKGLSSDDSAVGQVARRTIAAGQPLTAAALMSPKEITRGANVTVRVETANTQLSLMAVAQSSGSKGDTVYVKNTQSGRLFRAVVESKNQVVVATGTEIQ